MLKRLRWQLTLQCTLIAGAILLIMAFSAMQISEQQFNSANRTIFQNAINSLVAKLQSDSNINGSWLLQTEANSRLIIAVEENQKPFLFRGAWEPEEGREELIEMARKVALEVHGVDSQSPPVSVIQTTQVIFPLDERYQAAVVLVPLSRSWCSVTILMDMSGENQQILFQRVTFLCLTLFCMALLFGFSWWLAGRSIEPIRKNIQKQTEFVAAASHELKSPLAVIRASASAMAVEPERQGQFADNIERECGRLSRLIEEMLLLAGSDARSWRIRREMVDTDRLVIETFEKMAPVAEETGHSLTVDLPEEVLPRISGDFDRLQQILMILLDNAFHYTPKGTKVIMMGERKGKNGLRLMVIDHGAGIPDAEKERVFDRFFRAEKSRTDRTHFGLGLPIARELTQLHGGSLKLRDTQGGGCTFVIELTTPSSLLQKSL